MTFEDAYLAITKAGFTLHTLHFGRGSVSAHIFMGESITEEFEGEGKTAPEAMMNALAEAMENIE